MIAASGAATTALQEATRGGEAAAYYTEAQAGRGQKLFEKHCGACHFAEPDPVKAKQETRGFLIAKERLLSNLGGSYLLNKRDNGRRVFTTVYYLYRELESMPAVTDSIDAATRTDILAYLLKQNGFPAGAATLRFDLAAMKLMPLDEPGFVRLFNGVDFTGWKFLVGLGCEPAPVGCGRTTPGAAFTVRNGLVYGSGKEHGFMYTAGEYQNFTLRLDYLSEKPADWDADDIYYYANTGYHLFLMDENLFVWPKSMTLAGEQRDLLRPIGLGGTKMKAQTWDNDARLRVVRPLGEWNSIEIVSKDRDLQAYLNDTLVATVTQHEYERPGHIGLQMQGYAARWRNIRIKSD
jgi:mono/diheme cytochrome c family protein